MDDLRGKGHPPQEQEAGRSRMRRTTNLRQTQLTGLLEGGQVCWLILFGLLWFLLQGMKQVIHYMHKQDRRGTEWEGKWTKDLFSNSAWQNWNYGSTQDMRFVVTYLKWKQSLRLFFSSNLQPHQSDKWIDELYLTWQVFPSITKPWGLQEKCCSKEVSDWHGFQVG